MCNRHKTKQLNSHILGFMCSFEVGIHSLRKCYRQRYGIRKA